LHPRVIDLSLERLRRLLAALDHPERRLPPVIHVAGTNGKGSVCAYLRAMLEASGQRVHVFTSPHLVHFHERIRLAGALIDDDHLTQCLERCETANAGLPITEFEIVTAAALLAFAEVPADALVLEVGLGGRHDATNVVDRPAATAITPVSLDHQHYLGETIDLIAGEKAGILKPGVVGVVGPQTAEALAVIEARAAAVGAPLLLWGRDFSAERIGDAMTYRSAAGPRMLPLPALLGGHQIGNSAIAVAVAEHLRLPAEAIAAGLTRVDWPARLQRLHGHLLDCLSVGSELWVDGGHNPSAGQALASALAAWEARPLELVVGMLNTKAPADFLRPLAPLVRRLQAVTIPDEPNAWPAEVIAAAARSVGLVATEAPTFQAALRAISDPARVLICGSLHLAGPVLAADGSGGLR